MILQDAFLPEPSAAVAVIVALPFFTAVTVPFDETLAIFLLEDVQITFLLLAFFGVRVAFNLIFLPCVIFAVFLFRVTFVTGVPTLTVITVFFFAFTFDDTVILAVPFFFAVILPLDDTVATFVLLDLKTTFLDTLELLVDTLTLSDFDFPFFKVSVPDGRFVTLTAVTLPVFDVAASAVIDGVISVRTIAIARMIAPKRRSFECFFICLSFLFLRPLYIEIIKWCV